MKNLYCFLVFLIALTSCSEKEPIIEMDESLNGIELVGAWQIDMVITDYYRSYQEDRGTPSNSATEVKDSDDEVTQVTGSITFEEGNTGFFTVKNSRSLKDFDGKEFTWEIADADLIKVYFPKYWNMEWNMIEIEATTLNFSWLFDDTNLDLLREIKMSKL